MKELILYIVAIYPYYSCLACDLLKQVATNLTVLFCCQLQGITCLFCRFGLDFRLAYFSELIVIIIYIIIIILFVYVSNALIRLGPANRQPARLPQHTHTQLS